MLRLLDKIWCKVSTLSQNTTKIRFCNGKTTIFINKLIECRLIENEVYKMPNIIYYLFFNIHLVCSFYYVTK